jgi:hypothetical protein
VKESPMQTHYIYFLSSFIFACGGTTSNEEIDHFDQAIDTIEETAIDTNGFCRENDRQLSFQTKARKSDLDNDIRYQVKI